MDPLALGDGEPSQGQDRLGLAPRREALGHVASDDEGQIVLRFELMQLPQGIDRVGRAAPIDLQVRDGEALVVRDREPAQLDARLAAGVLARLLVRRHRDRHEHDAVEAELVERLLRHDEVTDVRRIERAAEDADVTHA